MAHLSIRRLESDGTLAFHSPTIKVTVTPLMFDGRCGMIVIDEPYQRIFEKGDQLIVVGDKPPPKQRSYRFFNIAFGINELLAFWSGAMVGVGLTAAACAVMHTW